MFITRDEPIQSALDEALAKARHNTEGAPADYIPELATVPLERTSAAICTVLGKTLVSGDAAQHRFTFQSTAKTLLLAGLLEEIGADEVFRSVGSEPSGQGFASLARLETHGPSPANPLVNAGAIALMGQVQGDAEARIAWILAWAEKLYGAPIAVDEQVRRSESETGHRNRAIANLLRHNGVLTGDVDEVLEAYFALCSLCGGVGHAARFSAILANGGVDPVTSDQVLSAETVSTVVALMATCGMYNESGTYLVETGMPAKSGVSGLIIAVVPGVAGIAVSSPRLNDKGGSVRGHLILRDLSRSLGWHFALAGASLGPGPDPVEG